MDKFIEEARLEDFRSFDELNLFNKMWVSETHNNKPHSALPGHITPRTAFKTDSRVAAFVPPEKLDAAFIRSKDNVSVDQTGIFRFKNCMYQVKDMSLKSSSVTIAWPPLHYERMYVWCEAKKTGTTAEPFEIGPYIDYDLKAAFTAPEEVKAEGSRLFAALLKTYSDRHPDSFIVEELEEIRKRDREADAERKASEGKPRQESTFTNLAVTEEKEA